MNFPTKNIIPALAFISVGIFFIDCHADDGLGANVTNGQFEVILPASGTLNQLRMVEWSTNLVDWEPVARDYGFDWGNLFPHALPVSTGGATQVLSDPTDTQSRYYRVVASATSGLNNSNAGSRFLPQALDPSSCGRTIILRDECTDL